MLKTTPIKPKRSLSLSLSLLKPLVTSLSPPLKPKHHKILLFFSLLLPSLSFLFNFFCPFLVVLIESKILQKFCKVVSDSRFMASRASRRLLKDFLLKRVTSTPVSSGRHFSSSSSSETAPKIPHFSKKVTFFFNLF